MTRRWQDTAPSLNEQVQRAVSTATRWKVGAFWLVDGWAPVFTQREMLSIAPSIIYREWRNGCETIGGEVEW